MKASLAILVAVLSLSGCAEDAAETPEQTSPGLASTKGALPALPSEPINVSYDGRTVSIVCIHFPVPGPCASPPEPDYKAPWEYQVNGSSIRLAGNFTWAQKYPDSAVLSFSFAVIDSETREMYAFHSLEGQSPLALDWYVSDLPAASSVTFSGFHRIWVQNGVAEPDLSLPQDYHFEGTLHQLGEPKTSAPQS